MRAYCIETGKSKTDIKRFKAVPWQKIFTQNWEAALERLAEKLMGSLVGAVVEVEIPNGAERDDPIPDKHWFSIKGRLPLRIVRRFFPTDEELLIARTEVRMTRGPLNPTAKQVAATINEALIHREGQRSVFDIEGAGIMTLEGVASATVQEGHIVLNAVESVSKVRVSGPMPSKISFRAQKGGMHVRFRHDDAGDCWELNQEELEKGLE